MDKDDFCSVPNNRNGVNMDLSTIFVHALWHLVSILRTINGIFSNARGLFFFLRGIIDISHFRFWKMTRYPSIVFFRALQEYETRFLFHMWNWEKRKVSKVKKCHFFTPKSRFLANFENENWNFDFTFVFRRKSWY